MLNQVEAGAAWPESATHARIVNLEELGAEFGKVMSYRPLTITAPLYRAWATMRLKEMEPWVNVCWHTRDGSSRCVNGCHCNFGES